MVKKIIYILLVYVFGQALKAQTGGDNVYEFLNLTHSGLISSLGGSNVSLNTDNLNLAYHNPAILQPAMNNNVALNYVNYLAGINYGLAMYSRSFSGVGNFAAGVTYLNYGSFTAADASGIITGSFSASEYAMLLIYSREIDTLFSLGINFKPVLSHLEKYTSFGFAFDFGAGYRSRSGYFSAGLVIKNLGLQVTRYAGEERQKLPFEIQAGFSRKLPYAPLRFSLTLQHLEKYNLTHQYNDTVFTNSDFLLGSEFFENMMRHVVVGAELIPHKNLYLSGGFNYLRRRDLMIESKISVVGFSWGFGINTSFMNIEFGRATYHIAGSSNHFSIIVKPDKIYNRLR